MKKMERIIDYIKSWFYYPKMEKYFDDRNMSDYNRWKNEKFARFKYAWWHCHAGKLKEQNVTDKTQCEYKNKWATAFRDKQIKAERD